MRNIETQTLATFSPHTAASAAAPQAQSHQMRAPRLADGPAIHRLVADCPPLDLNSLYAYLLLCEHHSATCVVAESAGGRIDGFISAYQPPTRPDVLFVWQVAVHESARGQKLARGMLKALLQRDALSQVRHLETTVGPDNQASRRTFAGLAAELGAHISEQPYFDRQVFGGADHDDEMLLKIGPFAPVSH
ncbi:diaminobutyrate acetyltransferase [Bordetella hinzii]|uniref:L-2,4-diaminobutyric acid acetyltransferase n=2 Tax=Bordetella hinzii TaxID=103855 RepID=A0AAN1VG86_9BORD|nr:diaminobutyrate acetyltransferase [Bordetella hinzii]AZW17774.1 diaminobutyrate acetyltransferase [Bordetella hinzii]KXA72999.1 L-2,4-diaminobutyric acid acetyltransferase [Bordetella hinzii LMG 13501]MBZ0077262.1 diaminobutyrate acetyltransferase [Bordetella hinzii]MBZ0081955.1 diaminobutyrate acetyltransferase [Bordetella hinzii]MBZ0086227.1 diaminobutyrate acetyltransferase [Bordetella hinzii]